jgi:drug/metabolite transporter (DMT)-like permease
LSGTTTRGVAAMFIAVAAFSFMDALLKTFSAHYPPLQVSAIRAAASLPFVLLPLCLAGRLAELRTRRPGMHLLRGLLGVAMLATFVFALRDSSLAAVYSVYMAAPLLIVVLAVLLLGERADLGRWIAVCVGLAGVFVILRPAPGGLPLVAGLTAAVSALCYALAVVTARALVRTDSSAAMVVSFLLVVTVVAGALAAPDWVPLRAEHAWMIATVGATGAVGQHFITEAFRHAPASTVAPIEYTALIWGLGIDWVAWSIWPSSTMLAGASLVVAAGLYVVWRERPQAGP